MYKLSFPENFLIISDEKGDRELAEDTWRTAGTGQKVANHFGGEMRDCMIDKIDSILEAQLIHR